jgi:hypothetical protein
MNSTVTGGLYWQSYGATVASLSLAKLAEGFLSPNASATETFTFPTNVMLKPLRAVYAPSSKAGAGASSTGVWVVQWELPVDAVSRGRVLTVGIAPDANSGTSPVVLWTQVKSRAWHDVAAAPAPFLGCADSSFVAYTHVSSNESLAECWDARAGVAVGTAASFATPTCSLGLAASAKASADPTHPSLAYFVSQGTLTKSFTVSVSGLASEGSFDAASADAGAKGLEDAQVSADLRTLALLLDDTTLIVVPSTLLPASEVVLLNTTGTAPLLLLPGGKEVILGYGGEAAPEATATPAPGAAPHAASPRAASLARFSIATPGSTKEPKPVKVYTGAVARAVVATPDVVFVYDGAQIGAVSLSQGAVASRVDLPWFADWTLVGGTDADGSRTLSVFAFEVSVNITSVTISGSVQHVRGNASRVELLYGDVVQETRSYCLPTLSVGCPAFGGKPCSNRGTCTTCRDAETDIEYGFCSCTNMANTGPSCSICTKQCYHAGEELGEKCLLIPPRGWNVIIIYIVFGLVGTLSFMCCILCVRSKRGHRLAAERHAVEERKKNAYGTYVAPDVVEQPRSESGILGTREIYVPPKLLSSTSGALPAMVRVQ